MGDFKLTPDQVEQLARSDAWVQKLAQRLVGEAAAAQDVVQDAYLVALTSPVRPLSTLRAWFSGVVRHVASAHLRREARLQRRQRKGAKGEPLPSTVEEVMRLEQQDLLIQALLKVPEPFREALILRYVEGYSRPLISARLQVPEATVKSRLERGRHRLRVILDAQHTGGRATWLAALAPIGSASSQSHLLPWASLFMKNKLIAISASCALTLLAAALVANKLEPKKEVTAPLNVSLAPSLTGAESDPPALVISPAAPTSGSGRAAVQARVAPVPSAWVVRGRCVDLGGMPIEGAVVSPAKGTELANPKSDPKPSDADGRFTIELDGLGSDAAIKLKVRHQRFATVTITLDRLSESNPVELGDLVLSPGGHVAISLVDQIGQALAGFRLGLKREPLPKRNLGRVSDVTYMAATADKEGRIKFDEPLVAGEWAIYCYRLGVQGLTPKQLQVSPYGQHSIEVVLNVYPSIQGQVVFSDGAAFTGSVVPDRALQPDSGAIGIQLGSTSRSRGETRVRAIGVERLAAAAGSRVQPDGSFTLVAMRGAEMEVEVDLESGSDYSSTAVKTTWGDQNVRLIVDRKPFVRIRVVDQATAQPISEYGISLEPNPGGFRYQGVRQIEPGRVQFGGLKSGTHWLFVIPGDGLAAKGPIQVETGLGEVTIGVRPAKYLNLRVTDASGKPVEAVQAQLIGVRTGQQFTSKQRVTSGRSRNLFPGEGAAVAWDRSKTGADGSTRLAWPDLEGWHFYIEASSPSLGRQFKPVSTYAISAAIVFPETGQLLCQLFGDWDPQTRLWIEPASQGKQSRLGGPFGYLMRDEVEHRFLGIPPGEWRVIASIKSIEVASEWITITPRGSRLIKMDARDFLIPSQVVQVTQSGTQVQKGQLRLHWPDIKIFGQQRSSHLDLPIKDGSCTLPALPPGTYRFSLDGQETSTTFTPQTPNPITLQF